MKLCEVATIIMGQSPSSESYNEQGEGVAFFQGKTDFGEISPKVRVYCSEPKKIAEVNDILISVRAPVGDVNVANIKCCIGRGLAAIRANKIINEKYLYYALRYLKEEIASKGTGSTFKAIGREVLQEIDIPMCSMDKQEKIVKILDRNWRLIQSRNAQIKECENLVKSRFIEMFGDLKLNTNGWQIRNFCEFAKIDTNMVKDFTKYADYPHIGIDSIVKDTGELKGYRTVKEDGVISGKYLFTPEHIIYSKIRPNLNKVALPNFIGVCSADAYPILPNKRICNRIFLGYAMRSEAFLSYILAFSSRTNLPKVNKAQVEGFTLPLPPIELQNEFATFVQQVDKLKFDLEKSLQELQNNFDALMQKAFNGELFS